MMGKPLTQSWHDYITQSPYEAFHNSEDYQKFLSISQCLSKVHAIYHGDLRYKNVAKRIVQEPTQPVAIRKGHPPFCFRFQCLSTGRLSKYIKEDDYPLFGITDADARNGNGYSAPEPVVDKFSAYIRDLTARLQKLYESGTKASSWWARYSEYLASEEWSAVRERVLERDGRKCVLTNATGRLHIHHLTYRNVGQERLADLMTLSEVTHKAIHDDQDPSHQALVRAVDRLLEHDPRFGGEDW